MWPPPGERLSKRLKAMSKTRVKRSPQPPHNPNGESGRRRPLPRNPKQPRPVCGREVRSNRTPTPPRFRWLGLARACQARDGDEASLALAPRTGPDGPGLVDAVSGDDVFSSADASVCAHPHQVVKMLFFEVARAPGHDPACANQVRRGVEASSPRENIKVWI